jgi:hypothetical protein
MDTANGPIFIDASDASIDVSENEYDPVSLGDVRQNRGTLVGLYWLVRSLLTNTNRQYHREYEEVCLASGDIVNVIGALGENEATGMGSLRSDGGTPLVVTTRTLSEVAGSFRSVGKKRVLWGFIVLAIGGALFAISTGLI